MMPLPRTHEVLVRGRADRVFPGAVAEIGSRTGAHATVAVGALTYEPAAPGVGPDTIFDLASLTKVLATTTLALRFMEAGALQLDARVRDLLPQFDGEARIDVRVRDLLEHSSGLPAHRPYYQTMRGRPAFERAIAREPLEYSPRTQSIYSDLGFMLLGFILEDAAATSLRTSFGRWRDTSLGQDTPIGYGPVAPDGVAPTEYDPARGQLLQGQVHDENAAALDGVAAHAGLFGTAAAVGAAARWWMRLLSGETVDGIAPASARLFVQRSAVSGSSRALGWDTMLPTSSCGTHLSASAIGHTGFTGTSLWIDPERDLYMVLLTNRVHPTRHGDGIAAVRRAFHDAVVADLAHRTA